MLAESTCSVPFPQVRTGRRTVCGMKRGPSGDQGLLLTWRQQNVLWLESFGCDLFV
jgi:hypothetical protein